MRKKETGKVGLFLFFFFIKSGRLILSTSEARVVGIKEAACLKSSQGQKRICVETFILSAVADSQAGWSNISWKVVSLTEFPLQGFLW